MARFQFTKIELLDKKHPGLRLDVDLVLDKGGTLDQVQRLVKERTGEEVPNQTLSSYKQRRWLVRKQEIENRVRAKEAILEIVKAHPEENLRSALIYEKLEEMEPKDLHRRDIDMKRLELDRQKYELGLKELERKNRELQLQVVARDQKITPIAGVVAEAHAAQKEGKPFDPAEAFKKISAVIGVGGQLEERVEPA